MVAVEGLQVVPTRFKRWIDTVDGRKPAPPKSPWNDGSLVKTNKQWFLIVSKWCEVDFVHPKYVLEKARSGSSLHHCMVRVRKESAPVERVTQKRSPQTCANKKFLDRQLKLFLSAVAVFRVECLGQSSNLAI